MKHAGKTHMAEKQTDANGLDQVDLSEFTQQMNNNFGNPWGIHKKGNAAEVKDDDNEEKAKKQTAHFREMSKKALKHAMELKRSGAVKDNKAALKAALNYLTLHTFNGKPSAQLNWGRAQRKKKAMAHTSKKAGGRWNDLSWDYSDEDDEEEEETDEGSAKDGSEEMQKAAAAHASKKEATLKKKNLKAKLGARKHQARSA